MDVEAFAKRLSTLLEEDCWGDIEPDIFRNIGNGFTGEEDPESDRVENDLWYDKCSREEMLDSIKLMRKALTYALKDHENHSRS